MPGGVKHSHIIINTESLTISHCFRRRWFAIRAFRSPHRKLPAPSLPRVYRSPLAPYPYTIFCYIFIERSRLVPIPFFLGIQAINHPDTKKPQFQKKLRLFLSYSLPCTETGIPYMLTLTSLSEKSMSSEILKFLSFNSYLLTIFEYPFLRISVRASSMSSMGTVPPHMR